MKLITVLLVLPFLISVGAWEFRIGEDENVGRHASAFLLSRDKTHALTFSCVEKGWPGLEGAYGLVTFGEGMFEVTGVSKDRLFSELNLLTGKVAVRVGDAAPTMQPVTFTQGRVENATMLFEGNPFRGADGKTVQIHYGRNSLPPVHVAIEVEDLVDAVHRAKAICADEMW